MFGMATRLLDAAQMRMDRVVAARLKETELRIVQSMRPPETVTVNRESIARTFLRGHGIEIGALHRPLKVPDGVRVSYVDMAPLEVLEARFPEVSGIVSPDIIGNGEELEGIASDSFDFIVANHFFEHTENPLGTLRRFTEVLRHGGVIFMAIPDKRWTFDKPRSITPLAHVIRDYREGPDTSRWDHYDEWLRIIDGYEGEQLEERRAAFIRDRVNIHFHVWTTREMNEMFLAARDELGIPVEIKLCYADPPNLEVVWVLEVLK